MTEASGVKLDPSSLLRRCRIFRLNVPVAGDADRYQSIDDTFVQLFASDTCVLIAICQPMQSDVMTKNRGEGT